MTRARQLELGISIIPYGDSIDRSRELVRVGDEGGLALVGVHCARLRSWPRRPRRSTC
jgi:hypothetical protein